jgi:hypothetical protein
MPASLGQLDPRILVGTDRTVQLPRPRPGTVAAHVEEEAAPVVNYVELVACLVLLEFAFLNVWEAFHG